jgi:hypothetical protein
MTRLPLNLAALVILSAVAVAACAGDAPSGSGREPVASSPYDRYNDVDRFPQPRGSSAYMRQ